MPSSQNSSVEPKGENSLKGYWRVYGGITAVLRSTYFWVAIVITFLSGVPDAKDAEGLIWPQLTISIVPSLLGLGVGAMALMLSFSSGRFLEAIKQKGKDRSYLRKVMASFYHFALVLVSALIVAYIGKAQEYFVLSYAGVFLITYGVLLTLGIVSRIWHTARIFNKVLEYDRTADDRDLN